MTAPPDSEIFARVRDLVVDQLGVQPQQVTSEARFVEDLGADSLDSVELVMAVEEEFDIDIPDANVEKLLTVGDLMTYIGEHPA